MGERGRRKPRTYGNLDLEIGWRGGDGHSECEQMLEEEMEG